jgi:hypothetical protein
VGGSRQTVNLFLTARWFESIRLHQIWLDRIKVITSDCLSDYRGSIPRRVAKQFRETRARCMGVTVNHWLEEFDPLTRSQF